VIHDVIRVHHCGDHCKLGGSGKFDHVPKCMDVPLYPGRMEGKQIYGYNSSLLFVLYVLFHSVFVLYVLFCCVVFCSVLFCSVPCSYS